MFTKVRFIVILVILSFICVPSLNAGEKSGSYYRHARIYGKVVHYDSDQNRAILFGSVFYKEPHYGWQLIQKKKFSVVYPTNSSVKKIVSQNVGKCAATEGVINILPGQKEEAFSAHYFKVDPNGKINIPPWYGFGITQRTEKIKKINLSQDFKNFVEIISSAKNVLGTSEKRRLQSYEIKEIVHFQKTKNIYNFRKWSNAYWNEKWCVPKDDKIQDEMRKGVGGWQFYEGLVGIDNCYITKADLQRKHIDKLMNAVPNGGGSSDEGPAVMCAHVSVQLDKYGNVVRVDASGFLHDNPSDWFKAFRDPSKGNAESWKLSISEERAKELKKIQEDTHDDICWLSGNRVFVRDEEGNIIDQYFSVGNSITRIGFNNVLDVLREIWKY